MIAVTVHPSAFHKAGQKQVKSASSAAGIRRPTRGIVLKEDTFATLRVVSSKGETKPLVDAGSRAMADGTTPLEVTGSDGKTYRATNAYSNFLIQQVQEDRQEKQQILETFGEPYIFLFGERARVIAIQGILINSWDFNWEAEWWHNYENYLRGTRCVENDTMVFLTFDNTVVGGYILNSSASKNAQDRHSVQFSFQMFVTFYSNFSEIGNPYADGERTRASMSEVGKFNLGSGKLEYTLSAAEAAVYRPPLISPLQFAKQLPSNGFMVSQPDFFLSVQQFAVNPLKKAWSLANDAVTKVTNKLTNTLQIASGMVEVPYGFAGTMVYDEYTNAIQQVKVGGTKSSVVTYTTFSDNVDEYVDMTGQYASAATDPQNSAIIDNSSDIWKQIDQGDTLSSRAAKAWGVSPSHESLGPISSAVAKGGLGMITIQGADGIQANLPTQEKLFDFKSLGTGRILNALSVDPF
jgi:hypothetical protein